MPLARGTAAVGYMTLLSVFMAAGMPIEAQIPEVPPVTKCLLISISWNRTASRFCSASIDESWLSCPQSYQPDWEAILSDSPRPFISSLSQWLYPKAAACDAAHAEHELGDNKVSTELERLPAVKELLGTMRARLEALNGMEAERIHAM